MSRSELMSDAALKPKLLRLLLREYIPDEKHQSGNLSILSYVVSTVKTHKLLSEQAPQDMKKEFIDAWKSAIDSWMNRVLSLTSSSMLDNSYVGICLLGLTCQECCEERFLTSYPMWLDNLLSHVQAAGVPYVVKEASCASISDLLTRLSGFPPAKKDGFSHATRIIQSLLKLLNSDVAISLLEQALSLLCILIIFFPSSVHQNSESIELAIVTKIMSGECSAIMIEKLGHALGVLSKSKRDENICFLLMEKILVCINSQLNEAFRGLEAEERGAKAMRALLPSDKDPPQLLHGSSESEQSAFSSLWPERLLGSRISSLMQCCCNMLRNVMVPVPLSGLIALVERVLMVDGISCPSPLSLMTVLKQELIFSEIPHLQLHSLEILKSLIEGLGKIQLLRCAPAIVQLLNGYLMRCKLPDLRIKAYSTLKSLINSVGVGMTCHITQDVISNIFAELDFAHMDSKNSATISSTADVLSSNSRQKKRKLSNAAEEMSSRNSLEYEISYYSTHVPLKLAAVEALEAFLTGGGSMVHQNLRRDVDNLLMTAATNARISGWSELHLASLRAFLASLISSGRKRATRLSVAQVPFREGVRPGGTKVSEFCRHALQVLELSPYPGAVPFSAPELHGNEFRAPDRNVGRFRDGSMDELGLDDDDELKVDWLRSHDEAEAPNKTQETLFQSAKQPPASSTGTNNDETEAPNMTQETVIHSEKQLLPSSTGTLQDELPLLFSGSSVAPECPISETANGSGAKAAVVHGTDSMSPVNQPAGEPTGVDYCRADGFGTMNSEAMSVDSLPSENEAPASASNGNGSGTRSNTTMATIFERIAATLPDSGEFSNDDQLPDIVDGDPDSDD